MPRIAALSPGHADISYFDAYAIASLTVRSVFEGVQANGRRRLESHIQQDLRRAWSSQPLNVLHRASATALSLSNRCECVRVSAQPAMVSLSAGDANWQ